MPIGEFVAESLPVMRRSQIIKRLETAERVFGREIYRKILEKIPSQILSKLYEGKGHDWVPVALAVEINNHISSCTGEDGAFRLSKESFGRSMDNSTLGRLLVSSLRLLKMQPTTMATLTSQFWKLVYKNCGEMLLFNPSPKHLVITINHLPEIIADNRAYLLTVAGAIYATLRTANILPMVTLTKHSGKDHIAVFDVTWS